MSVKSRLLRLPTELRLGIYEYLDAPIAISLRRKSHDSDVLAMFNHWLSLEPVHLAVINGCSETVRSEVFRFDPALFAELHSLFHEVYRECRLYTKFANVLNSGETGGENVMVRLTETLLSGVCVDTADTFDGFRYLRKTVIRHLSAERLQAPLFVNKLLYREITSSFRARVPLRLDMAYDLSRPERTTFWPRVVADLSTYRTRSMAIRTVVEDMSPKCLRPHVDGIVRLLEAMPCLINFSIDLWFEARMFSFNSMIWGGGRDCRVSNEYAEMMIHAFLLDLLVYVSRKNMQKMERLKLRCLGTMYSEWTLKAKKGTWHADNVLWVVTAKDHRLHIVGEWSCGVRLDHESDAHA